MSWTRDQMSEMAKEVGRRWASIKSADPESAVEWDDVLTQVLIDNGFVPEPVYMGMLDDERKRQKKEKEKRKSTIKDDFPPYTNRRTQRRRFR